MNNNSVTSGKETLSDIELNAEFTKCTALAFGSGLTWLTFGAIGFPFITKRLLQGYFSSEYRFLISSVSAVATSFFMGYRSRITCEENARKSFIDRREKALEEQKTLENKKKNLEKEELPTKEES